MIIAPRRKERKRMGSKWWHWSIILGLFGFMALAVVLISKFTPKKDIPQNQSNFTEVLVDEIEINDSWASTNLTFDSFTINREDLLNDTN